MTTSHRLQRTTLVPAAPPLSLTWIILVASSQVSSPLLLLHSNRDKAARVILLNSDSVPPLFKTLQWLSAKSLRWPPGAYNPPCPPNSYQLSALSTASGPWHWLLLLSGSSYRHPQKLVFSLTSLFHCSIQPLFNLRLISETHSESCLKL